MALGARGHEVVDGYVWLEENRPGLGPARLHCSSGVDKRIVDEEASSVEADQDCVCPHLR
jgi:hypothetical protein